MLEPPSSSVCLNCLSHPGLLGGGGGGSGRWGGGASGAQAKKHLLLSRLPRTHPSTTPPTPGPQARSRLPDLSQREVSGFSRKHTRARTDGRRVHSRGRTPLPNQAGQVSRGHQQVGGSATPQVPGSPWPDCSEVSKTSHLVPKVGSSHFQQARHWSRALACLVTASPAPRTVPGTVGERINSHALECDFRGVLAGGGAQDRLWTFIPPPPPTPQMRDLVAPP